jgi:hypothetical protein
LNLNLKQNKMEKEFIWIPGFKAETKRTTHAAQRMAACSARPL